MLLLLFRYFFMFYSGAVPSFCTLLWISPAKSTTAKPSAQNSPEEVITAPTLAMSSIFTL